MDYTCFKYSDIVFDNNEQYSETALCLSSFSNDEVDVVRRSQNGEKDESIIDPDDGCKLVLGLGPTTSAYYEDHCKNHGIGEDFSCQTDSKTCGFEHSDSDTNGPTYEFDFKPMIPVVDEGSTSARKSGGYMPSMLLAPRSASTTIKSSDQGGGSGGGGGGRMCGYEGGCLKSARGKSGFCIRHGGGKRCQVKGCARSAEGQAGLCISHGGGRRCHYEGCNRGAQGRTKFCKAHGGGKRCVFGGCTKGAEGSTPLCKRHGGGKRCLHNGGGICPKSVHGGTNFCVAHGGGKRCNYPECTKSARGRTDCCVKHGGGKRCKHENCGKSAQGSTEFCKAHGGGKRCEWGNGKCEKFARGKRGLCAAHSRVVSPGHDGREPGLVGSRLFHGVVATSSEPFHHLIPPQVLVPLFMKSSSCSNVNLQRDGKNISGDLTRGSHCMQPERRVHGGKFMSFLQGNLYNKAEEP